MTDAKPKFIDQLKTKDISTKYDAGVICERDGNYLVEYEMQGAEKNPFQLVSQSMIRIKI